MYNNFRLTESEREDILNQHKSNGYRQPIKEDTIGSYERQDLQRIDPGGSHTTKADNQPKSAEPQGGWWNKHSGLNTVFNNGKLWSKIYWPLEASKLTGYVTLEKKLSDGTKEYYYCFGPDMKFFIFQGKSNWGKQKMYEGTWKMEGANLVVTTSDGDVYNSSTNAWIGTANADAQSAASQTGRYTVSNGFPLLYMQKGGEYIPKLQTALGVKPDGLFGPKTNQALVDKNIGYNANVGVTQDMYNKIVTT
jgi:hypothetical protein